MGCCESIEESNVGVIENCGKFDYLANAGFVFVNCLCCQRVAARVSLRVQQLNVILETKSKDNVFVHITVAVQYQVMREKAYEAYYKLAAPQEQIKAHVSAAIRARAPKIPLDGLFEVKEDLAQDLKKELLEAMSNCGYTILDVLITDIEPDAAVKHSMNEINAAERQRQAALSKAETAKILRVKEAEAEAESRHLAGKGLAMARAEIVNGLEQSVSHFTSHVEGTRPGDVMQLILATQYFDTLKEIGSHSNSNVVYLPHSMNPDIGDRMREALITGSSQLPVMTMPKKANNTSSQ